MESSEFYNLHKVDVTTLQNIFLFLKLVQGFKIHSS